MRAVKNSPTAPLEERQLKLFPDACSEGQPGQPLVGISSVLGGGKSRR
jgi:hypothetical protein